MSKKMFVGNLSFQTTEADIREAFAQFGNVESVAIITDRDTGRSKGFGFVEMSEEDANKAIAKMNGTELKGRLSRMKISLRPLDSAPAHGWTAPGPLG